MKDNGSLIGPKIALPTTSAASAIWSIPEQQRAAAWPTPLLPGLLAHMNGTDTSTTFTDSSNNALTLTAGGNAQIDTAIKKYGTGSGLFDGTGDYVTVTHNSVIDIYTGDWTVEGWVYSDWTYGSGGLRGCIGDYNGSGYTLIFNFQNSGQPAVYYSGVAASTLGAATLVRATWTHFALVREGTALTLYMGGVAGSSPATVSDVTQLSGNWLIGGNGPGGSFYWDGNLDDFRITKAAVYTENFTPPTSQL